MYKLWRTVHLLLLGTSLAAALVGCKSRIPTAADIKAYQALDPFLVAETDIRGVYENIDVDSLVFTYTTSVASEDELWKRLEENLRGSRWEELAKRGAVRQFERTYRRGETAPGRPDMPLFSSAELMRIAYLPRTREVVVGYIQADCSEEEVSFRDTAESRWGDRFIWPQFDRLLE